MTAGIAIAADSTDNVPTASLGQNEWSSVAPSNPMNVTSNDGSYVTTNVADADQGYGFGFSIPAGSIIGGITVKVDAKSTDTSGCQLAVRLSGDTASSFTARQNRDLTQNETILTYGGSSDTWGQVWDPTMFASKFRLEIRNLNGSNCADPSTTSVDWIAVSVQYTKMASGDENVPLSGTICKSGDFNFIIDQSGSIGQQGDIPSNLQQLKDGINGFVTAFQSQAGASGLYSGTKFSGSSASGITSGYVAAGTFQTAVDALTNPSGLTPTGLGITTGAGNDAGDRAGIPNVMFVVTDGSPNKPNTHSDDLNNPDTWLQGANAAIGAADDARTDGYVVKAVYLSTATDPGDTSLPFSAAGDAQWATAVMDNIGGGDHFSADFTGFIDDLFKAIDCPPPPPAVVKVDKTPDHANPVNAGDGIGFNMVVWNEGASAATEVKLSDTLPANAGLNWQIQSQGAGWNNSCVIDTGVLKCGGASGKSIPANTQKGASTFTVHITSTTTKNTAGTCPGTGTVDNTANVTSANGGNPDNSAHECVQAGDVKIDKTPDHASPVNAGDQIGFTLTVFNAGGGTSTGVKLSDTLPTNTGLDWSIAGQGAGWGSPCAIAAGVLTCGGAAGVTVPGDLSKANSTFTVHITSTTTKDTAGTCPGTGTVSNTGSVTSGNDGSDNDTAVECVAKAIIKIDKTPDHDSPVNAGDPIGFTLTVYNAGSGVAAGVKLSDILPTNLGLDWIVANTGAGWGSPCAIAAGVLTCGGAAGVTVPGDLTKGASTFTVHITSTTSGATAGTCPGTGTVTNTGSVSTTNDGSDSDTAVECVEAGEIRIDKTPDHQSPVDAGDQIGFTLTVFNGAAGSVTGVKLSDILPTNPGLDWTVADSGAGWGSPCAIAAGVLSCGGAAGVTVPGNLSQGDSTFTVHITSLTTKDTAGTCPGSGTVTNLGSVSTTNAGSDEDTASECVEAANIAILKTADHVLPVSAGDQIGFTVTVWNIGGGNATGVKLSDVLPIDPGTAWTIESQGAGWADTCAIAAGILTCGGPSGLTVPGGTTFGTTTFDVHIVSPTTALTAGTCPGTGSVDNTGSVTTGNDGSGQSSATECVESVDIRVAKIADDQGVVAGQPIGFTIVLWNPGLGNAAGVKLSDLLPTDAGLNWQIAPSGVGQGWTGAGSTCAIAAGSLTCGGVAGVTVPGSLSQGASLFTVHIVSTTTAATADQSPVQNQACVSSSNGGEGCADDDVDVFSLTLEKANDAPIKQIELPDGSFIDLPTQEEGKTVTYTLSYDVGVSAVHNAFLTDVLPVGVTYVAGSATSNGTFTFVDYVPGTRTLTWHADTVSADGSVTYQATVDKDANKLSQPLVNNAAIESNETPEDTAQSEVFVPPPPRIETHVVTGPPTDVLNRTEGTTKGSSLLLVLSALALVVIAASFVTPVPASVRRRTRR